MITAHWFQIFAVAFAAFAFGFGLCNAIWVFFSPQKKRKNCDDETSEARKREEFDEKGN